MSKYILTKEGELYNTDELMHHGVKGQKWGVRRYQNKDGSLTPAGQKRYNKEEYKIDKKHTRNIIYDATRASNWSKAYDSAARYDDKRLKKQVKKDLKKHGLLTEKTKEAQRVNAQLHRDKEWTDQLTQYKISKAKKHIAEMKRKYGDRKVKDMKTYIKSGQEFVKGYIDGDLASYSVQKRSYIDGDGNKRTRYTRVRTTYQYV